MPVEWLSGEAVWTLAEICADPRSTPLCAPGCPAGEDGLPRLRAPPSGREQGWGLARSFLGAAFFVGLEVELELGGRGHFGDDQFGQVEG